MVDGATAERARASRHDDVGSVERAVAEQLLDIAKVRSCLEEVGGERVPKHVGGDAYVKTTP